MSCLSSGSALHSSKVRLVLVLHRKDLCEARPKMQSVFKLSDNLSALSQMDPPIDEAFGHTLGQADLWSDVPHQIRLPVRLTFGQTLGLADLFSDVPPIEVRLTFLLDLQVRLTFTWMYPLAETSCGQVHYYCGQADLWSDVSPPETFCGKVCYYFSQVHLYYIMVITKIK